MDPRCVHLAEQLLLVECELRKLGYWSELPPSPDALASQAPFCVDTLAFEQWLQWIFLPRMKIIVENDLDLPQASGIRPMAEVAYRERLVEVHGLLNVLGEFDRLIGSAT